MPSRSRSRFPWRTVATLALVAVGLAAGRATASATGKTLKSAAGFADTVAAVFTARCVRCHGADQVSSGLRLDSYDGVMGGGDRGPAVVPGNGRASLILQKVRRHDLPAMPPKHPLPATEIRQIQAWIEAGALP